MEFSQKYTSTSDKDKPGNAGKKIISDDAFAIGEMIEQLAAVMGK